MARSFVRLSVPVLVASAAVAACSGTGAPDEDLASSEGALRSFAVSGTGVVSSEPKDAGTADANDSGKGSVISAPIATAATVASPAPSGPASCALTRIDLVADGRTCWSFAKRTPSGLWTVTSAFPDAPAAVRDTRCALTWIPNAPTCAEPDVGALGLTCHEYRSMAWRSAACAANPAACESSGSAAPRTPTARVYETSCEVVQIDGGSGGGYSGGCDSCGVVSGGMLYALNPYGTPSVVTDVWSGGVLTQLTLSAPPYSSFVVPLSGSTSSGTVPIWRP